MALEIATLLPPGQLDSSAIVGVSPHPARRRRSGVDHVGALAAELARATGRPLISPLVRVGRPTRQVGTSREARTSPGRIAFEVVSPVPTRVLLVDDVHTTGATLRAATEALRRAGCGLVMCASFARTLREPAPLRQPVDW